METTNLYKRLEKIIIEVTGGRLKKTSINESLKSQGLGSLNFIELLAKIEEEFDFEFNYDDIIDYNSASIKTLYDYISSLK
jgi:acyl carrier protein